MSGNDAAGDAEGNDQPSDRLRERAAGSQTRLWFLLEADRRLVTGLLLGVVFLALVLVGYLYPTAEGSLRTSDSVDTLFQAMLGATITGVTLVLTLNQLVLSQELGAVGDQRERMSGAMSFREDAADVVDAPVSPPRPAQFLRALVQVAGDRAATLREAVDADDPDLADAVEDLTASLTGNAERVAGSLDDAQFGEFEVLSAALNFNYSWKIFTARRIRERFGDELTDEETTALDELVEVLELFGPAREHFKTLYFQWELIDLSRTIMAAAVPSLVVSAGMLLFFNDATYHVTVFGVETLVLVFATTTTLALLPFFILLAYVLRIATVTKHTLSIGPFILRETDQVEEVEWDG
ncbi:MAG: hypothetical protein ABEJ06_02470 [Haloarculaceae archaeon]